MRRITFAVMSTIAAVILLFSYRTSTRSTTTPVAGQGAQIVSAGTTGTTGSTVVAGSVAQTRWGPVQVQVTIAGGKITDVQALQQPTGNRRDEEINSYALPQLHDEVLATQGPGIDAISGATVTSDGYVESLQAALDAAHFG